MFKKLKYYIFAITKFICMSIISFLKGIYLIIFNRIEISAVTFIVSPFQGDLDNCAYIDKLNSRYMDLMQYSQQNPIDNKNGEDNEDN